MFVWRKHRVEHLVDLPLRQNKRQPLQQPHPVEFKRRQMQSVSELEVRVAQNFEWDPQPRDPC
jgi:hypothetical protein